MSKQGLMVCPTLERGRSGVGDYSLKLAEQFVASGANIVLAAWNDSFVNTITSRATGGLTVLRIPSKLCEEEKLVAVRKELKGLRPAWTSVQFVSYGYHSKGLPSRFGRSLQQLIQTGPAEVMFHELWCGGRGARWRDRVYGFFQRRIIGRLIQRLKPVVIHTHAVPYLESLSRFGGKIRTLPLFSNIPVFEPWSRLTFGNWLEGKTGFAAGGSHTIFCLFGSLYPDWKPDTLLPMLRHSLEREGKRGLFLSIGHLGEAGRVIWQELEASGGDTLRFFALGPLPEAEISQCLHAADYGVTTTPPDLIEKSGTAAAMFEHGLPVLASRPPVYGDEMARKVGRAAPLLVQGEDLPGFLSRSKRLPNRERLGLVAHQFLEDLGLGGR